MVKKEDSTGKRLNPGKSFYTDTWCGYVVTLATQHVHALTGIDDMKNTILSDCLFIGVGDQTVSLSNCLALTCSSIVAGRGIILHRCACTHF